MTNFYVSDFTNVKLLKNVAFATRPEDTDKNLFDEKIKVLPTFPYNPESKTSPETARLWVEDVNRKQIWNYQTGKLEDNPNWVEKTNDAVVVDNTPTELTIIDLEARGNGGRAYKVIDPNSRLFDLREDQLIEAIKMFGILPGGKINGKFVWAVVGSQTKLIAIGGEIYNRATKVVEEVEKVIPITKNDLVEGEIYQLRTGEMRLYLGKLKLPGSKSFICAFKNAYSTSHISDYIMTVKDPSFVKQISAIENSEELKKHRETTNIHNGYGADSKEFNAFLDSKKQLDDLNDVRNLCAHCRNHYAYIRRSPESNENICYTCNANYRDKIMKLFIKETEWETK